MKPRTPIDDETLTLLARQAGLSLSTSRHAQLSGFYNFALLPMLQQLDQPELADTPVANTFDPR